MQEIHVYQTAEERVVKCVPAGSAVHQFENEAHRAQHKARQERRDRPLGIEPGPEDSQNKAGRDWRADVALHALQVNIKLTANQMDEDRKSTRLNSSHLVISYAGFCLK